MSPADVPATISPITPRSTGTVSVSTPGAPSPTPVVIGPTLTLGPTVEPTIAEAPDLVTATSTRTTEPASGDMGSPEDMTTPTTAPERSVNSKPTAVPTFESTATAEPTVAVPFETTATEEPTATPTEEPTATPTEEPTATLEPVPETQVQTIYPVADTSVTSASPDTAQSPDLAGDLTFGGPDGAVSYLTFDVSSVALPGSVVSATLTLTGTGARGALGGELLAIPGAFVDEYGATWNTRPSQPVGAIDQYGSPVWIDWIAPGGSSTVDVTGTVSQSGVVTFVLIGLPDSATSVGSRESGLPPYLTVETVVYPGA